MPCGLHALVFAVAAFAGGTASLVQAAQVAGVDPNRPGTVSAGTPAPPFPRLMGMNIGAKNYEDPAYQQELARLAVVILGFYRGWGPPGPGLDSTAAMQQAARAIKARNPALLLGQYTVLNEVRVRPGDTADADLRAKLDSSDWWLTDAAGRKVQWTSAYGAWEVNLTRWAPADARGGRWPEWLAGRNHAVFFRDVPEFDIVYVDNVMGTPRVKADWDRDGRDDDATDPRILAAHRAGYRAYWERMRALAPTALLVGNADNDLADPAWRGQLDGAFLEALMGERWSIEARGGWNAMMARYRAAIANTRPPRIVGFNVWGDPRDLRFFRYAYASCLLDDGYFSFTDRRRGYDTVPWFAEYDFRLGRATSAPPVAPWRDGVWRRDFEHGVVLVNPTASARTVAPGPDLAPLSDGSARPPAAGPTARLVTLGAKDGLVLARRRDDAD